jgi:hypothetical protein
MIRKILLSAIALCASQVSAGPISKYDDKKPDLEMVSSVPLFDIERCMTDMDNWPVPFIYRQPDRPGELNMLWVYNMKTIGRAYFVTTPAGVVVKIWNAAGNQTKSCLATGKPR